MPEGDTLRRLADAIAGRFTDDVVQRCVTRDPRLVGVDLTGRRLTSADAYGKHLFIRFDHGATLHAHLLMTGSFCVGRASAEPAWKRRIELELSGGQVVGEMVPVLGVVRTADEGRLIAGLGPDLCGADGPPDAVAVAKRMREQPSDLLSGAMLDQRNVAGFGNIYANEVPFIVGVSPFQAVGSIDDLDRIVAVGVALIRTNAERGPQNTTGRRLHTSAVWVHGVGRRPCPVCGRRLSHRTERESPWGRSITWCAVCQPQRTSAAIDDGRVKRLLALHPAVADRSFPV
jgi:endonuclease-8